MTTTYIDIHAPLVERCRKGDSQAQHELYRLYARSMFNASMRIVNHIGEAEDILQESFLEAFQRINDFRAEVTFGAWLKRIVVNRSVNCLKKIKPTYLQDLGSVDGPEEVNEEDISWEVEKVYHAINELPDGYRTVLSLFLLEGYDHGEISQILGISESTSKSQYNRAKNKVRELLKQKSNGRQV